MIGHNLSYQPTKKPSNHPTKNQPIILHLVVQSNVKKKKKYILFIWIIFINFFFQFQLFKNQFYDSSILNLNEKLLDLFFIAFSSFSWFDLAFISFLSFISILRLRTILSLSFSLTFLNSVWILNSNSEFEFKSINIYILKRWVAFARDMLKAAHWFFLWQELPYWLWEHQSNGSSSQTSWTNKSKITSNWNQELKHGRHL